MRSGLQTPAAGMNVCTVAACCSYRQRALAAHPRQPGSAASQTPCPAFEASTHLPAWTARKAAPGPAQCRSGWQNTLPVAADPTERSRLDGGLVVALRLPVCMHALRRTGLLEVLGCSHAHAGDAPYRGAHCCEHVTVQRVACRAYEGRRDRLRRPDMMHQQEPR